MTPIAPKFVNIYTANYFDNPYHVKDSLLNLNII